MTTNKAKKPVLQPIDKFSLFLIVVLSLVTGLSVWGSKICSDGCFFASAPGVANFSWQNKQVGVNDTAFILTFDRPVDRESVEKNLVIDPPLLGKFSWAGMRVAYTLAAPAPYGTNYRLELKGARVRFPGQKQLGEEIELFIGQFSSRDRALAYIGDREEEQGRLILYNWTKDQKFILTPPDLTVIDFKPYPSGDRLLFSAAQKNSGTQGLQTVQLYSVTTKPPHQIELILDNKNYQNNNFDISPDGKTIVVQRVNLQNPADFGLWLVQPNTSAKSLEVQGGEFLITPDGQNIAVAQGEGIAILPLKPGVTKQVDFLPKFGRVLGFSKDGSASAMVNFNTDKLELLYTRSLFYVNNQGIQKELLNIKGSILQCEFNPTATHLYCLLTQLIESETEEYKEQPYFVEIDIKTAKVIPLLALPEYQDIQMSMAPDGLGILFDRVIPVNTPSGSDGLRSNSGEAISGGSLWILFTSPQDPPEQLPFTGFHPQWLP